MSIFRESFPDFIQNQINLRQDLISGDERSTAMRHLNSRSSWVRMSSSVNVGGSSDLAKENVLFAGSSSNTGIGTYKMNEGFGNSKGTYKKGPLGFRPMPGIDNISVKNRGAYGSLREVTVNFKCWDINQLEDLEVLYMRPGYTVLIEWGWSNYLATDKNNKPQLKQMGEYYDILNIAQPKTISEITKELREKIKNSQGNYDAMFGKVKNYSWSARTDGGYDCTTTIISMGEVIESLKINNTEITLDSVTTSVSGVVLKNSDFLSKYNGMNLSNSYDKNLLAGVFHELYAFASSYYTDYINAEAGVRIEVHPSGYDSNLFLFTINNPGGVPPLTDEEKKNSILLGNIQSYITLESLCELFNNSIFPRYNSPLKIRTKSKNNNGDLQDNLCIWNPLQVSVDPSICIISSPVWSEGVNIKSLVEGAEADKQAVVEAEKKSGSGLPDEAGLAADAINTAFSELMLAFTDNDIVKPAIYNFIVYKKANKANGNRSSLEAAKAIEELQKQYEKLRGNAETIKEIFPGVKDERIDSDIDKTKKYWNFSGITKRSKLVGGYYRSIFEATETVNKNDSYISVDTIKNYMLPAADGNSDMNFASAGHIFSDDDDFKDAIEAALKDSKCDLKFGENGDTLVGRKLSKEVEIIEAQKVAQETQTAISSNKSIIKYISNLAKPFPSGEKGIIGNIYINLNYLYKRITSDLGNSDRQERNEINVYDFFKGILKDVQASIGNLNSFEIYVDDDHASIIDINFSGNLLTAKSSFQIQVQNKKSVVRNYTLQSQIFPEQSSMISIAAQANQDALNTDTATLKAYSHGISDRTVKISSNNSINDFINSKTDKYKVITRILSQIALFFGSTTSSTNTSPTTTVSSNNEYKNALRDLIQFSRNFFAVPGNSYNVIIPTKLSLTLDGLGGIIIGNLFRISDNALPKGYNGTTTYGNRLGYIVTDLSQDVKNGEWTTTIGAQTIVLDSPGSGLIEWDYNKLVVDIDPTTTVNEGANRVEAAVKSTKSTLGGVDVTNGALPDSMMADLNALRSDLYTATKSSVNQSDGGRVRLYKNAMSALIKLLDAAKKDGITFHINSAFRTYEDQVRIRAAADEKKAKGEEYLPAASPGTSNHGFGLAIDFANKGDERAKFGSAEHNWLKKNAKTYNFFQIYNTSKESHHWEYRATETDAVKGQPIPHDN